MEDEIFSDDKYVLSWVQKVRRHCKVTGKKCGYIGRWDNFGLDGE